MESSRVFELRRQLDFDLDRKLNLRKMDKIHKRRSNHIYTNSMVAFYPPHKYSLNLRTHNALKISPYNKQLPV